MKLELRELAPYLPYGLKVKVNLTGSIFTLKAISYRGSLQDEEGFDITNICRATPILRPLSDLTKEEYINYGCNGFDTDIQNIINKPKNVSYQFQINRTRFDVIQKLFEWHFDVFGLIEQGLAIDINTL